MNYFENLCSGFPNTVNVCGKPFAIYTAWQDWVRFGELVCDRSMQPEELVSCAMQWFDGPAPEDPAEGLKALVDFFAMADGKERMAKKGTAASASRKICFDYDFDAPFLFSAFWEAYSINLAKDTLHWWEFRWLFNGLPDDCQLVKRIQIRATNAEKIKNKEERRRILQMQRLIAIPHEITDEEIGMAFAAL